MANWASLQQVCALCQGSGYYTAPHDTGNPPPEPSACPQCQGEGYREMGRINMTDVVNAIVNELKP